MKITLTNQQMVETVNTLSALEKKVLPLKLSFAAAKNAENLKAKIYRPYVKELEKVKEEFTEKDETGKKKKDGKGRLVYTDVEAYGEKLQELLEIENEFDCHEITEDMLEQCMNEDKYASLTMGEVTVLMRFAKC